MSGQAKRSRVRALLRHREQGARLIALAVYPMRQAGSGAAEDASRAILDGGTFDVALAREYGERLVVDGQAHLDGWAVYLDWLREHGWIRSDCPACSDGRGRLKSKYVRCVCSGTARGHRQAWAEGPGRKPCPLCKAHEESPLAHWNPLTECTWCVGSRYVAGKRPRMDGANLVRMGRRLLAALEEQPSDCRVCSGAGGYQASAFSRSTCLNCRGTGHNLAGVLPATAWAPAVLRHGEDARAHRSRAGMEALNGEYDSWAEDHIFPDPVVVSQPSRSTRAVPRGQHRALESMDMVRASGRCTRNVSVVDGQSLSLWAPASMLWRSPGPTYEERLYRFPRWLRREQLASSTTARQARRAPPDARFHRLGYAALGDGLDCARCSGTGREPDGICDECFGRGRPPHLTPAP